MKILVLGATGFIGRHLIKTLSGAGHKVVCSARGDLSRSRVAMRYGWMPSDFGKDTRVEDWMPRLKNKAFDVVINAVGILRESGEQHFQAIHEDTPKALFQAASECEIRQIIQISALGADKGKSRYYRTKKAADDFLSALNVRSAVLRPSIVYGEDGASTQLFMKLARLPVIPLVGHGDQKVQPIHIDELCKIILNMVEKPPANNPVMDIVGPDALSLKQLLTTYRQGLGKGKPHFIYMPTKVVRLGAWLGDELHIPALSQESLDMLLQDSISDPKITTSLLGKPPRKVEEFFTTH